MSAPQSLTGAVPVATSSSGELAATPAKDAPVTKAEGELHREVFSTSRCLEYFSVKELTLQTSHDVDAWPDVLLKEIVDNALDAAEGARVVPIIDVNCSEYGLTVTDNGPGIAPEIVERILDFARKTSSKDFYLSPTRGAQGNALKTVLAIPYVLSGNVISRIEIESRGIRHEIAVTVNRIKQEPVVHHTKSPSHVKIGTVVRISSGCFAGAVKLRILQRLDDYRLFNPHVTINRCPAGDPAWTKWKPSDPISPHWYQDEQFTGLIAAYLSAEQDGARARYVRDLIANFRGLSSTARQKKILSSLKLTGAKLSDLAQNKEVNRVLASGLLAAMKAESREVKPQALGIIGEEHTRSEFLRRGSDGNTFRYRKFVGLDSSSRPFVVEVAFALFDDEEKCREVVTGLNFTPCITDPFHDLGDESLSGLLSENHVKSYDCCVVMVHLTAPHLQYADRGKSSVQLPDDVAGRIITAVNSVCSEWKRAGVARIKNERRGRRVEQEYRTSAETKERSIKDIVAEHLPAVYALVSGNGELPAGVRQLFYGLRPLVLEERPDKEDLDSVYITQTLIPNFIAEHPELCAGWDVVFDARGHFTEPHTGKSIGIGTLEVRAYAGGFNLLPAQADVAPPTCPTRFETSGPRSRFNNVLFIEKEGFLPLLESAGIADRYDLAIMSTKGLSSTAARRLVESMPGVRFFALHDFDKAGFSIVGTLQRDTRRYQFKNPPEIIDLGLRLEDVRKLGLASEAVPIKPEAADNLRENGTTEEEILFLLGDQRGHGRRVELNAMTSPQFIEWLERKLRERGVKKFIPDADVLEVAFRKAILAHMLNLEIERLLPGITRQCESVKLPKALERNVKNFLRENPSLPWDDAISKFASKVSSKSTRCD